MLFHNQRGDVRQERIPFYIFLDRFAWVRSIGNRLWFLKGALWDPLNDACRSNDLQNRTV